MKQQFFRIKTQVYYLVLLPILFIGFSCKKDSPPVANFSSDSTTVYKGGFVMFIDKSKNSPNYYKWHFPGGTPEYYESTQPKPSYFSTYSKYDSIGSFSVTLTVRNGDGESTITKNDYITVIEDIRPTIHGRVIGVHHFYQIWINSYTETLGVVEKISDDNNSFELRIPVKYLGKTLDLNCSCYFDELTIIVTKTVSVTITQETYIDFYEN